MKNKLTLLVDSNWLLQSRFAVLSKEFNKTLDEDLKKNSSLKLQELIAKSIVVILSKYPVIDNILFVKDGGTWRKQLKVPEQILNITYKGNRNYKQDIDWSYIYNSLDIILNNLKDRGVVVSQGNDIEGDDWIWYWVNKLNSEGINCMIWTSDNDLKQLVNVNNNGTFTVWYNQRNGLWLPESSKISDDPIDFFMSSENYYSGVLEDLKRKQKICYYVNPDEIIIDKIICGDSVDNILPIIRYKKGTYNFKITKRDWNIINRDFNIDSLEDFLKRKQDISEKISSYPKWKDFNISVEDILTMIDYNTNLVWLNESTIPDTIIQYMNNSDYKVFDVKDIRYNYKYILNESEEIYHIYDSI